MFVWADSVNYIFIFLEAIDNPNIKFSKPLEGK